MLKEQIGFAWKMLPPWLRLKLIRATQQKFTVSAAAIVTDRNNKVLLLNHVLRPFSGWGLPGGFLDRGEQPEEAIRRELHEETGIELADLQLIRVRTIGPHIEILFKARTKDEGAVMSPREILDLGWFCLDAMPDAMPMRQKDLIRSVVGFEE